MPPDAARPHSGPSFNKSSPELVERFGAVVAGIPGIEQRQMFGYAAAFASGYMFTGLHQANWVVRLPPDALDELASAGGRPFEPMPGRPMTGYLAFPEAMVDAGESELRPWIERSLAHVRSLPPKVTGRKSRCSSASDSGASETSGSCPIGWHRRNPPGSGSRDA